MKYFSIGSTNTFILSSFLISPFDLNFRKARETFSLFKSKELYKEGIPCAFKQNIIKRFEKILYIGDKGIFLFCLQIVTLRFDDFFKGFRLIYSLFRNPILSLRLFGGVSIIFFIASNTTLNCWLYFLSIALTFLRRSE